MQGLLVHNEDGSILHEQWLEPEVVAECITIAEERNFTLAAYCGERIVTVSTNEHTDRLIFYQEPTPEGLYIILLECLQQLQLRFHTQFMLLIATVKDH